MQMRICLAAWVAIFAFGCAGGAQNANVIATYQGVGAKKDLQSCTLEFWWKTTQLQRFCGEPKWKVSWLGRRAGSECWVYANEAAGGATYSAVCLQPDGGKLRVKEAIGLRTAPDGSGAASGGDSPTFAAPPPPPPPPPPPADPNAPPPPEPN